MARIRSAILLLAILLLIPPISQAEKTDNPISNDFMQGAVSVTCTPAVIKIDVSPTGTGTGLTNCTATNDNPAIVSITITISAGGLEFDAPSSLDILPLSEEVFQISVRAELGMAEGSRSITVTIRESAVNGVPLLITAPPRQYSVMATIMQYSDLTSTQEVSEISLVGGESFTHQIRVENTGNAYDRFNLYILNDESSLQELGIEIDILEENKSVEVAPNESAALNVTISLPTSWISSPQEVILEWSVSSEYSEFSEEEINSVNLSTQVNLFPSFGMAAMGVTSPTVISIIAVIALGALVGAAVVVVRRMKSDTSSPLKDGGGNETDSNDEPNADAGSNSAINSDHNSGDNSGSNSNENSGTDVLDAELV